MILHISQDQNLSVLFAQDFHARRNPGDKFLGDGRILWRFSVRRKDFGQGRVAVRRQGLVERN